MKIGIFTAMEKEATPFLDGATKITDGAFALYNLRLGKHEAVLICPPNTGEICASSACQLLISKYHVDVILNFGIAGALTEQMSVATFVCVNKVVHYDMDTSQIDNVPVGYYSCFDSVAVPCNDKLISGALSAKDMPLVTCASADKFVAEPSDKLRLHERFQADICDMESAGILWTCKFNNVPCLLIKCISDAIFTTHDEYYRNSFTVTQDFFNLAKVIADKL